MDNENNGYDETLDIEAGSETVETSESIQDIKARLAKAEEVAENYKIRAEKAEKKKVEVAPQTSTQNVSLKDSYALLKADVPDEAIDDILEFASVKKMSVSEALQSNIVKAIIADKKESIRVSEASHTGSTRRTQGTVSAETLLRNFEKGILPESEADMERLAEARINARRTKK